MSDISAVKALVFDVFGTVVDWRTSLINASQSGRRRAGSVPTGPPWSTAGVRSMPPRWTSSAKNPQSGYVILDTLHRQSLETLVKQLGISGSLTPTCII